MTHDNFDLAVVGEGTSKVFENGRPKLAIQSRGSYEGRASPKCTLHYKALVGAVWVAVVLRGLFYCVEQPIWEGFDEWAYLAYIQCVAEYH